MPITVKSYGEDFDKYLDKELSNQTVGVEVPDIGVVQSSVRQAKKQNPEAFAKAVDLSEQTGIPSDVVNRNMNKVELDNYLTGLDKHLANSPILSKSLLDQQMATLAQDDIESLSLAENSLNFLQESANQAWGNTVEGAGRIYDEYSKSVQSLTSQMGFNPAIRWDKEGMKFDFNAPVSTGQVTQGAIDYGKEVSDSKAGYVAEYTARRFMDNPSVENAAGFIAEQGPGALVYMLMSRINPTLTTVSFGEGIAEDRAKNNNREKPTANDLSIGLIGGYAMTKLEQLQADMALKGVAVAKSGLLKDIALTAVSGGMVEGVQTGIQLSGGGLNTDKGVAKNSADQFKESVVGGALIEGGIRTATGTVENGPKAVKDTKAILDKALNISVGRIRERSARGSLDVGVEAVKNSKLRQRSPKKLEELADKFAQGAEMEIEPEALQELFQTAPELVDNLEKYAPEVLAEAKRSMQDGSNVVIPISKYMVYFADQHEQLSDFIKVTPDGLTAKEAEAQVARIFEQSAAEQVNDGREQVKQDMFGQLKGIQGDSNADTNAEVYSRAIRTLAERAGMTPTDLAKAYKLDISRYTPESLRKPEVQDNVDLMIDRLRNGDIPTEKDAKGQPVLEFLRSIGGLKDDGGELSARDLNKKQEDFGKLSQPEGLDFDTAIQKLIDAGYVNSDTGQFGHNELMDLIDNALQGNNQYSSQNQNDVVNNQREALNELERHLNDLGLDINSMTNDEIRAALYGNDANVLNQAKQEGYQGEDKGEAKEWLAAKAKGLDMSHEARMQRAKEMGFVYDLENLIHKKAEEQGYDTTRIYSEKGQGNGEPESFYHGTVANINEFILGHRERKDSGWLGSGIYFTDAPEIADLYRGQKAQQQGLNRKLDGNVLPVHLKISNPFIFDETDKRILSEDESQQFRQSLIDSGYDSVIMPTALGKEVMVLEPNQIRSINAAFDPDMADSANILYQDTVDANDLYVSHNLTEANLKHSIKMGGLPIPSLAVASTKHGFDSFGEISLISSKELLDDKSAKTYNADVYSPRYPSVVYEVDSKKVQDRFGESNEIAREQYGMRGRLDADYIADDPKNLKYSEDAMLAFLLEKGIAPKPKVKKPVVHKALRKYFNSKKDAEALLVDEGYKKAVDEWKLEEFKIELAASYGVELSEVETMTNEQGDNILDIEKSRRKFFNDDQYRERVYATKARTIVNERRLKGRPDDLENQRAVRKKVESTKKINNEFQQWAEDVADELITGEKIFKGFTNSGSRRYAAHTLENVVKHMKGDIRGGEGFSYGVANIRAGAAKKYNNVKQIQGDRDSLVSSEDLAVMKDEMDSLFIDLSEALKPYYKYDTDGWRYSENVAESLTDVATGKGFNDFENLPNELRSEVVEFINTLRNMPSEYFESKVQRAVGIEEFEYAVVPKTASKEVKALLKESGIKVKLYDDKVDGSRTEAISKLKNILFQESRGSLQFNNPKDGFKLELTPNADHSTFVHELAHYYFEVSKDLAKRTNAPEIQADLDALNKWHKSDLNAYREELRTTAKARASDIDVDALSDAEIVRAIDGVSDNQALQDLANIASHERFARGFEAYLSEGKSPTPELAGVYARFFAWLKHVYKSMKDLNIELSDDVRNVYDRMLATQEEIDNAKEMQGYRMAVQDYTDLGVSKSEAQRITALASEAEDEVVKKMAAQAYDEAQRSQKKWWKEERARITKNVEQEIKQKPVYQAIQYLQGQSEQGADAVRMSKQAIVDEFGKDFLKRLPRGKRAVYADDGVHPSQIAMQFGYMDYNEMLVDMVNAKPMKKVIADQVTGIMESEYGNMLSDGSLKAKAMDMIHSEAQAKALEAEENALAVSNKQLPTKRQLVKEAAEAEIGAMKVREIRPFKYQQAEAKYGRMAFEAGSKGDYVKALEYKRLQIANFERFKIATKRKDQAEKIRARLDKYTKPGTARNKLGKAGEEYLDAVDEILDRIEFKKSTSLKKQDRRTSLNAFIKEQADNGFEIDIPNEVIEDAKNLSFKNLTFDKMVEIDLAVQQIAHLARTKNKLMIGQQQRDFAEVKMSLLNGVKGKRKHKSPTLEEMSKANWRDFDFIQNPDAWLSKVEGMMLQMDGERYGEWSKSWFGSLREAQMQEHIKRAEYFQKYDDISSVYEPKELYREKLEFAGNMITRNELLSIALNYGNTDNKDRLYYTMESLYGVSAAQAEAELMKTMSERDWKYVQNVWNMIDEFWPDIRESERMRTGRIPEKVEPVSFTTPYGTFAGGYYPIARDVKNSKDVQSQIYDDKANITDALVNNSIAPSTKKGHREARKKNAEVALRLDLSVVHNHVNQVIHDLEFFDTLRSLDKLLSDKDLYSSLHEVLGHEKVAMLRPFLTEVGIGNPEMKDERALHLRFAGAIRRNTTLVNMGYKITTAIQQPLGITQSMVRLGVVDTLNTALRFWSNPVKWNSETKKVFEKSVFMKNRMMTFDRDISAVIQKNKVKARSKYSQTMQKVNDNAYMHIGVLDLAVSVPTWITAFEQHKLEGKSEKEAIAYADHIVATTQSNGDLIDLAKIQRGGNLLKLFTMFQSFFNAMYNMMGHVKRKSELDWSEGNRVAAVNGAVSGFMLLVMLPALLAELIVGRGPDEDEDTLAWAVKTIAVMPTASIPFARDAVSLMASDYGYQMSPVHGGVSDIMSIVDAGVIAADSNDELTESDIKHAYLGLGYAGLPVFNRQSWILVHNAMDYMNDEEFDAYEALMVKERKD